MENLDRQLKNLNTRYFKPFFSFGNLTHMNTGSHKKKNIFLI